MRKLKIMDNRALMKQDFKQADELRLTKLAELSHYKDHRQVKIDAYNAMIEAQNELSKCEGLTKALTASTRKTNRVSYRLLTICPFELTMFFNYYIKIWENDVSNFTIPKRVQNIKNLILNDANFATIMRTHDNALIVKCLELFLKFLEFNSEEKARTKEFKDAYGWNQPRAIEKLHDEYLKSCKNYEHYRYVGISKKEYLKKKAEVNNQFFDSVSEIKHKYREASDD